MGKTQRDRCEEALAELARINRTMEQGTLNGAHVKRWKAQLDYLADFVFVETGRRADPKLDQSAPLVCYFGSEEDRTEFIKGCEEALPGGRWKEMP